MHRGSGETRWTSKSGHDGDDKGDNGDDGRVTDGDLTSNGYGAVGCNRHRCMNMCGNDADIAGSTPLQTSCVFLMAAMPSKQYRESVREHFWLLTSKSGVIIWSNSRPQSKALMGSWADLNSSAPLGCLTASSPSVRKVTMYSKTWQSNSSWAS